VTWFQARDLISGTWLDFRHVTRLQTRWWLHLDTWQRSTSLTCINFGYKQRSMSVTWQRSTSVTCTNFGYKQRSTSVTCINFGYMTWRQLQWSLRWLRLSWPQNSRGEGKIPFNHVCSTQKTRFSNGSKGGFPFGRDSSRPTQTQSALWLSFSYVIWRQLHDPDSVTRKLRFSYMIWRQLHGPDSVTRKLRFSYMT
jgi:hypothetical protein